MKLSLHSAVYSQLPTSQLILALNIWEALQGTKSNKKEQ